MVGVLRTNLTTWKNHRDSVAANALETPLRGREASQLFVVVVVVVVVVVAKRWTHTHKNTTFFSLYLMHTHTHTQSYKREKRRNQKKVIEKRTVAWAGHQNPAANGLSFMGALPTTTWKETCLVQCLRTLTMRTLRVTNLTSWLLTRTFRPISENGANCSDNTSKAHVYSLGFCCSFYHAQHPIGRGCNVGTFSSESRRKQRRRRYNTVDPSRRKPERHFFFFFFRERPPNRTATIGIPNQTTNNTGGSPSTPILGTLLHPHHQRDLGSRTPHSFRFVIQVPFFCSFLAHTHSLCVLFFLTHSLPCRCRRRCV